MYSIKDPQILGIVLMKTVLTVPVTYVHRDVYKLPLKYGHLSNKDNSLKRTPL